VPRHRLAALALLPLLTLPTLLAQTPPPPKQTEKPHEPFSAATFSGLKLRALGPALTSGRVIALAVDPKNPSHYYVAAASGGVWKTVNAGTTWAPVFDNEGSYSIGAIALDPKNPLVVWVGTGENNSQRSVSYGDGVYRSDDGGKSWRNVGLKKSEHIGRILIDPRNSNVVYVAAQGPLWNAGGDRGLYKTTDGGKTWKKVLSISEDTGVTDVVLDPRSPDVLLAAAYQRRRHVWTLINGGPESAIYKSTDGGASWRKVTTGLPKTDLGRISLAIAPSNPDVVYAGIESIDKKGGVFRSADRGETWERRNDFDQGAMYFAGVVVDPKSADRIYVMGVYMQVSGDGGKTLRRLGSKWRHVDDHALWIDPKDNNHYRVGCDGGVYESHDRGANWAFVANLPITQFYDICVDETGPFYHVYGGTQDNFSLGGPARTRSATGITNADWFVTQGGDGFQCRVDPKEPTTVYCEMQYGVLTRYDRRSGENLIIQPQPGKGEPPLRWNWDAPLVISPHDHKRLYFAANILFRSDDRGDSWRPVSPDLTRQLDRDKLKVMGKFWGPDAVAKHQSTSFYGNCIALSESPKKEGLLYVGTDDGLVQVTDNGGKDWRKIEKFPAVPDKTYVTRLLASQHEEGTVYLAFDNHKNGDFAPYLLKSTDAGRTWKSIVGDLPGRGSVLAIVEDHVKPDLLFVGTEFGLFFTVDGGKKWVRLKGGMPTIAVKDLAIQRQVNDLAVGTFGRGIYILDDYSPLREATPELLAKEVGLFPVREAQLYVPKRQYGLPGKAFLGAAFYTANNPPFGATFTYHLKDAIKTQKQQRRDAEKKAAKKGNPPPYPAKEQLRAEAEEEAPQILLTVMDAKGNVLRTLTGPVTQGLHRVSWDLREPGPVLPKALVKEGDEDVFSQPPSGPLVLPGTYKVALAKRVGGVTTPLGLEQSFLVVPDSPDLADLAGRKELYEFQQKVLRLQRAVAGALDTANDLTAKLERIKRTLDHTPGPDVKWKDVVRKLEQKNRDILRALRGDKVLEARSENVPHAVSNRVNFLARSHRNTLQRPTQAQRREYAIASAEFTTELGKLRTLIEKELPPLQRALEEAGAPWVPGRLPDWKEK
jgi:photosystem II stability/assembly factor-like uncharacterized protein